MRKTLLFLPLAAIMACTTVEPGNVGVEVYYGTIEATPRQPGLYHPVIADIHMMSTRTQTYTMAGNGNEQGTDATVNVLAHDQLPVSLDVSVMFHLNGDRAVDVFKAFGVGYADSIVHPLVRTAVRDAASEFRAVDLIDQRARLQARMTTLVRETLASTLRGRSVSPDAVTIDNILVRNIDLPQSIDDAIANVQRQQQATEAERQANLTAQQRAASALTLANSDAQALLARTRADTEAMTLRATAQAEANRTLAASLTPELLAYERIQATRAVLGSNQTRTVFLPGATAPNLILSQP